MFFSLLLSALVFYRENTLGIGKWSVSEKKGKEKKLKKRRPKEGPKKPLGCKRHRIWETKNSKAKEAKKNDWEWKKRLLLLLFAASFLRIVVILSHTLSTFLLSWFFPNDTCLPLFLTLFLNSCTNPLATLACQEKAVYFVWQKKASLFEP